MIIKELALRRFKDKPPVPPKRAVLCLLDLDDFNQLQGDSLLRESDYKIIKSVKNQKRIREFSLGRAAAYSALSSFFGGKVPDSLSIRRGVFGQPYLEYDKIETPEISIAHSSGMAAALVFDSGQQLAVDIEELRSHPGRMEAIRSSLVNGEESLVRKTGRGAVEALYTLWTLKEGLGKVLKTGITPPLELFEISRAVAEGSDLICYFRNFHQYRTFSRTLEERAVFSLIHPLYTEVTGLDN